MGDRNINDGDLQEVEAVETLSLADFPITQDHEHHPSSSATEEFFEFFRGGLGEDNMMSHAEDIIFCGKLVPINEQPHREKPPQRREKHHRRQVQQQQPIRCRRSESMSEVKSTTASPLIVTNSRSLDYKKLHRNTSMSSEPAPEIHRDGSGKKSSSSSRWFVLLFGLVKVPPPEMDIRDIKNRQVRRTTSKPLFPSSESCDVLPVSRSDDRRKCSWRVLGFLSCKSSASAAVTTPLSYMPKV